MSAPVRRLLLAALAACSTLAAAAPEAAALRERVDAAVRPVMAAYQVPGMAVAVTLRGQAQVFSYGVADRETGAPVTPATLFELGSVSKTFAATLAGYAQAQGRLNLDDAPGRHLPWLKGTPLDGATLLHLGTYTAGGLPLQFPDGVQTEAQARAYLRSWKPAAAPGTQRNYSNPSIALLGRIAATALGQDYATALEQGLLPQLGLANSFVRVPTEAQARYAWGHDARGRPVRVNPGPMADEAYGLKASAEDMIRFVQLNLDPGALPAPLREAVLATQRRHFEAGGLVQGLGWEQYPYPVPLAQLLQGNGPAVIFEPQPARPLAGAPGPGGLFNKTGSTGGFGCYVVFVPQKQAGVVLLANRSFPIAERVRLGVALLEALAEAPR